MADLTRDSAGAPVAGAGPLSGVLVADLSRVLAGPMATMMLADLGATVVKVERPGAGDDTRAWGPPWTGTGSSAYYECVNRSKRSVTLDFDLPADRVLARELCHRADVVVENFRPGALDRYGLGYRQLKDANPRLVYCSITGFGDWGGADRPGYDVIAQAIGGLMSITGEPDGEPQKVGVALVDVLTGKDAVIGILAALAARADRGGGQHIRVNLLSSLLAALSNQAAGFFATGASPTRMGNRHPSIAPYEAFRCRSGHIVIACGNDGQFHRLTGVLGIPELSQDLRFATNAGRVTNRTELVRAIEGALASDDAATWEARLVEAGVPAGCVRDIAGGIELADALGLQPLHHLDGGRMPQVRHPISFSGSALTPPSPPPHLGEHDQYIRAWLATPTDRTASGGHP